jgi:hypothetical protein
LSCFVFAIQTSSQALLSVVLGTNHLEKLENMWLKLRQGSF